MPSIHCRTSHEGLHRQSPTRAQTEITPRKGPRMSSIKLERGMKNECKVKFFLILERKWLRVTTWFRGVAPLPLLNSDGYFFIMKTSRS